MSKEVKIGLIGFGTVGSGVISALQKDGDIIASSKGVKISVSKIADIDVDKKRPVSVDRSILTTDAYQVINDPSIDIVVEAVGGTDPALKFILGAIKAGKHVVTSNKEVIAKYAQEIFAEADKKGVKVLFEGSVGGGIPIISSMKEILSGNSIQEVYGIVNGTTNYILSKMTESNRDFNSVLKEAQALGYAEADPKNDVEGYDASYKAAILAMVAFGKKIKWEKVYFEGIKGIFLEDVVFAKEMGYVIKLLAIAKRNGQEVEVRVHPSLISREHPLAGVNDAFNAIYVRADNVGELMFYGEGAGGGPTASAVISDVMEIALNPSKGNISLKDDAALVDIKESDSRFYVRLKANDSPGVLAAIAGAFGDKNVSILSALQKETVDNIATIVIITHKVKENNFSEAISRISKLPQISGIGSIIRVGMEQ